MSHEALEEIRIRAVEQVQSGESPESVIKALGFSRSCIYTWLAMYRAGARSAFEAYQQALPPFLGRQVSLRLSA